MSLVDHVRGWGVRRAPAVSGPLPSGVTAVGASQRSVPEPPTCGALDRLSGAVCTLPRHSDPIHEDRTDPLTAVRWRHDEHTIRRPQEATK